MSFSTDPFCSSVGATSYQQKGARSLPSPHFSFQTASKRSRTWLAPSAAMNSTPLWRLITRPRNGCPVATAAAKSIAVNVLAVPHCPDSRPCPRAGSTCFTSHVVSGRGSALPCTKSCGRSDCSGLSSSRSASSSSGSSSGSSGSSGGEGGGGGGGCTGCGGGAAFACLPPPSVPTLSPDPCCLTRPYLPALPPNSPLAPL